MAVAIPPPREWRSKPGRPTIRHLKFALTQDYRASKAIDTHNHSPPAHSARMLPVAAKRFTPASSCLTRSCGLPRAFLFALSTVFSLTHHRLHLLSSSGKRNFGFPREIWIAFANHTILPMTLTLTSSVC
eukprot:6179214-Pleurochrysis_carterae.AAC.5